MRTSDLISLDVSIPASGFTSFTHAMPVCAGRSRQLVSIPASGFTSFTLCARMRPGCAKDACFNPRIGIHFIHALPSSDHPLAVRLVSIPASGFTSFTPGRCVDVLSRDRFNPRIGIHFIHAMRRSPDADDRDRFQSPHRDSLHSRHDSACLTVNRRSSVSIPASGFTSFTRIWKLRRRCMPNGFNPRIGIHFIHALTLDRMSRSAPVSIPASGFTSFTRDAE